MEKKNIAVLFGGCSPEYEVSLESAYSVIQAINKERYEVILIGITKEGDWFRYDDAIEKIKNNTWQQGKCSKVVIANDKSLKGIIEWGEEGIKQTKLDAAFPILHGKNGEDGTVQGALELAGIPIIGCDTLSSSLCMDKHVSHMLVKEAGIKVAKSIVIQENTLEKEWKKAIQEMNYPVFVKPMRAGSSFGITKVYEENIMKEAIKNALQYDSQVIVEENIDGIEVGCAVLGKQDLLVGEIDEIELSQGFFDYTEKYTLKTSKIHVPARIKPNVKLQIQETAKKIYQILQCKDFARVDMFLTQNDEIYFNEINTIPGFTAHSRYPSMMKEKGISLEELVEKLICLEIG